MKNKGKGPEFVPLIAMSVNIPNGDPVPRTNPQKSGLIHLTEYGTMCSLKISYTFSSPSPFLGKGATIAFSASSVGGR